MSMLIYPLLGLSIYYVRTKGEGGGVKKLPKFANNSTDRLCEMQTKGGGDLNSRKICKRNKLMPPYV